MTSSMPWKPDQSLTDKFLVVSCTYRDQFWTAFGPRDLFHAFSDPLRSTYSRHVWTFAFTLATGVLLRAHARTLPPFLKCVRWEDIFPFLAIGIPSIPAGSCGFAARLRTGERCIVRGLLGDMLHLPLGNAFLQRHLEFRQKDTASQE